MVDFKKLKVEVAEESKVSCQIYQTFLTKILEIVDFDLLPKLEGYKSFVGANSLMRTSACRFPQYQFRPVTMRVTQVAPPAVESHDQKNMRLKRPLSPHLLIYKPQLTSMLSITHRITGMALSFYALGFAAMSLSPGSFPHMVEAIQSMHIAAPVIFTTKLILSLPVSYHLCNGIRHLVWDFGKALTIKDVYTTGYILCGATAVLTLIFAAL